MEEIKNQLIEIGTFAFNRNLISEGKELDNWIKTRNSIIHKLQFVNMSVTFLSDSLSNLEDEISKVDPTDNKKIYDLCFKATITITYHLECFIYHLLSSLDNLKAIIPFFYNDVNFGTTTMRKLYSSIIKQDKLKETSIRRFIESKENKWLVSDKRDEGLYGYRAQIYHWLSNLCGTQASLSFPTEDFAYKLKITLPKKLSIITGYEEEIGIKEFVEKLLSDYKKYIKNLILSIKEDIQKI